MPLIVGVNSYASRAEANAWFKDQYGYFQWSSWSGLDAALISATGVLDAAICGSSKADPAQPLLFPIVGQTTVPDKVKVAQYHIAYAIVVSGGVAGVQSSGDQEVVEIKAGPVGLKFADKSSSQAAAAGGLLPDQAKALLKEFGLCDLDGGTVISEMWRA